MSAGRQLRGLRATMGVTDGIIYNIARTGSWTAIPRIGGGYKRACADAPTPVPILEGKRLWHAAKDGATERVRRIVSLKGRMASVADRKKFDQRILEFKGGEYGDTPLLLAAHYGHREIASILIAAGACCNVRDSIGWTPLILSSYLGDVTNVELLIFAKADLGHVAGAHDGHGVDALLAATSSQKAGVSARGQLEVVRLLLHHGAERGCRDSSGRTALDYCSGLAKESLSEEDAAAAHELIQLLESR